MELNHPNSKPVSIVFFGAGPVASQSLEQLIGHFKIEAVITKPKSKGNSAPVIDTANSHGIPTLTPSNRLELTTIFENHTFSSQVGVVIDFGIIISSDVFDSFPYGIVNSHFSLLPELRGADPITFAILSGQKTTGVSLMRIVEALDEGPIIYQESIKIPAKHDVAMLTADLINLSSKLLAKYLPKYLDGSIEPVEQAELSKDSKIQVSYSRKLNKADGQIDWTKAASAIEREIRAFVGWPQSRSKLGSVDLIITEAEIIDIKLTPGQYQIDAKSLIVGCGQGSLKITRLKPIGKKEMDTAAFLAGYGSRI